MAYGVTASGFIKKTVNVIVDEMKAEAQTQFGSDIDLGVTSPLMQFIEVIALEEAVLWDLLESMYYAVFIEFAAGENLDRVVAIVGIERQAATKATGTQTFTATQPCTVLEGTIVQTDSGIEFETDSDLVFVGSGSDTKGVTAVIPGTEGNVSAATITTLKDPIIGISSTNNVAGLTDGTDAEIDAALRSRTKAYTSTLGKGTVESIVNAVLAVAGVTGVSASEDFTLHKLTLTVSGVSYPDSTVDDAIEDTRPAGIEVVWQNPTYVDIYVDATATYDGTEPVDANDQVIAAVVAYVNGLNVGDDVIYAKLYDVIYNVGTWVFDVTVLELDTSTPPTGTSNVVITATQKAQTVTAKVRVPNP